MEGFGGGGEWPSNVVTLLAEKQQEAAHVQTVLDSAPKRPCDPSADTNNLCAAFLLLEVNGLLQRTEGFYRSS